MLLQRQTWLGDFIINCLTYYIAIALSDWKLIFSAGSQQHGARHFIIFNISYGGGLLILIPKCALGGFADSYLTESPGQNGYPCIHYQRLDAVIHHSSRSERSRVLRGAEALLASISSGCQRNFNVVDVNCTRTSIVGDFDMSA